MLDPRRLLALPWPRLAAWATPSALVVVPLSLLVIPAFATMFREVGVCLPAPTEVVLEQHAAIGALLVAASAAAPLARGPARSWAIFTALLATIAWPVVVAWALWLPVITPMQKL